MADFVVELTHLLFCIKYPNHVCCQCLPFLIQQGLYTPVIRDEIYNIPDTHVHSFTYIYQFTHNRCSYSTCIYLHMSIEFRRAFKRI